MSIFLAFLSLAIKMSRLYLQKTPTAFRTKDITNPVGPLLLGSMQHFIISRYLIFSILFKNHISKLPSFF